MSSMHLPCNLHLFTFSGVPNLIYLFWEQGITGSSSDRLEVPVFKSHWQRRYGVMSSVTYEYCRIMTSVFMSSVVMTNTVAPW